MSAGSAGSVGQLPSPAGEGSLDPTFVRALRLFHSTSKDSIHQLKAMLDEVIQGRPPSSVNRKGSAGGTSAPPPPPPPPSARDEQRRSFETLKRDLNDLMDSSGSASSTAKRARLHGSPGFSKSHTPSPSATPTPPTAAAVTTSLSGNASSTGGEDVDFGDLEGLNDLTCCVCEDWAQGNGNKLMECHTCQNLYHQECHSPVISDEEAGDPRLVWNCSQCKAPSKPKLGGGSGLKSSSGSGSGNISSSMMKSRTGSTTSSSSAAARSSSSDKHSSGGLGPSYKSSSGTSSSSKGSRSGSSSSYSKPSGGSTSGSGSSSSLTSADKRLQMMKKKAAQKRK